MKKGVGLITLVITIIVVVILAAAVILNLNDTNIINEANNAVYLNDVKTMQMELEMFHMDMYIKRNGNYDRNNITSDENGLVYYDGEPFIHGEEHLLENKNEDIFLLTSNKKYEISMMDVENEIEYKLLADGDQYTTSDIFVSTKEEYLDNENEDAIIILSGELEAVNEDAEIATYIEIVKAEEVVEEETSVAITVDDNTEIFTENATLDGNSSTKENPIIPKGFKPVNALNNAGSVVANWNNLSTDWNKGLVIQDSVGNQFVWVPIDRVGTLGEKAEGEVTYNKWTMDGSDHNDSCISDDTLPNGIVNETAQITTYGGFYVARYEAGKETGDVLVSKHGSSPWVSITYTNAKSYAESMYTDNAIYGVKSGLLTGTMWDTVLDYFYECGGKTEADLETSSSSWGNYNDSSGDADILGHGTLKTTGYSDYWQAGNIYNIASNVREWTNEKYNTYAVYRAGDYITFGGISAGSRYKVAVSTSRVNISFRIALFIQP